MKTPNPGVPVFRPGLGQEELQALAEVFASGWLGNGPKALEFEGEFAQYVGSAHAVAVTSGTAALHLSCLALGIGPGDEVLVPSLTFVSTAHAPTFCGAKVVFAEVDPATVTLDPSDLRSRITARTKAVIPVHYGGHPCRMEAIWELAEEHGLIVIEDAAHACGALYRDRRIGGLPRSKVTCFSFNALKNLCTGDGGMVTTNCATTAERIRQLRWMGIEKNTFERAVGERGEEASLPSRTSNYRWFYEVRSLGFKYLMNDVTAAIGLVQLGHHEERQQARRRMADRYARELAGLSWLQLPTEDPEVRSAWHLYPIQSPFRDQVQEHLREKGIATSVHYHPLHLQPFYRELLGGTSLPVSEQLGERLLTLPFHPNLRDEEITRVIGAVRSFSPARESVVQGP